MPMLLQAIQAMAGPYLLAALTFGALLRIASACALYGLLLRISRPSFAAIATITALLVSSTDVSDTAFYYNHLGAALVLIGTYLGTVGATGKQWTHRLAGVCGGGLITYAVAVKQTMILGAAAAVVALIVLALPRPRSGWTGWLLSLSAGGAISVAAVWAWLARNGLLDAWQYAMARAADGKGGIGRSLMRPLTLVDDIQDVFLASIGAWIVIGIVAVVWRRHERGKPVSGEVLAVSVGLVAVSIRTFAGLSHGRGLTLFLTALGWWGSLALALLHVPYPRRMPLDPVARTIVGLGVLSFGIGYSFTVSWPLFENAAFPGLALVVAATLERPPSTSPRRWVVAILILAHLSMGLSLYRKFTYPHLWGSWIEPPLSSPPGAFKHPSLVGLRISAPSSDLYTLVARMAEEHSTPDDRIYVFPNLPILYAIADRRPATFALAHWVDICPDYVGREDAVRLRTSPPKIMILRDDPVGLVGMEEWLYRGGEASSVRDILAALEAIKPSYDRVSVFRSPASWPISIFVRREHTDGQPGRAP
ncbi:MAG: hypothetical protein JJE40_18150 [Vicinamibacteria bacterium]|nr:hypothetical protein [Vicinamibacteria bacterium]